MPVWKNKRTGHTVAGDEDFIAALGADKYEKVADESAEERRLREQEEARAAKVEIDDSPLTPEEAAADAEKKASS